MKKEVVILIAEDDPGHAILIQKNLRRAGVNNEIIHFADGQETLDFLRCQGNGLKRDPEKCYVLLLDIRMPRVDGIAVLREINQDQELKNFPVIVLTTTDDPKEIQLCHSLGCKNYITKPVEWDVLT